MGLGFLGAEAFPTVGFPLVSAFKGWGSFQGNRHNVYIYIYNLYLDMKGSGLRASQVKSLEFTFRSLGIIGLKVCGLGFSISGRGHTL